MALGAILGCDLPRQDHGCGYARFMMLSKLDRNKIYEAIAQSGLDLAECKLTVNDDKAVITHDSGSTYEFAQVPDRMREAFSSGVRSGARGDKITMKKYAVNAMVIDGSRRIYRTEPDVSYLIEGIREWAGEVKLVVGTTDYWEDIQRGRELIAGIEHEDSGNSPFTQEERELIATQLKKSREQVREQFSLPSEQITRIEERLDEAAEASKRMGRKDWLLLFSGTIFTLIVTDTVTPGVAEHIFITVIHGLIHLFTGGSEPPRILT
jgi:hypothetical protein